MPTIFAFIFEPNNDTSHVLGESWQQGLQQIICEVGESCVVLEGFVLLILFMNDLEEYLFTPKLLPKNIDIISHEIVLSSLIEQIQSGEIVFKNSGKDSNLTNAIRKKSIIIENILLNLPLPILYVEITTDSKYRPVDIFGYELLKVIKSFLDNQFKLTNLEFLSRLNGYDYNKLPEGDKRVLFSRVVSFRAFTARMPKLEKYVVMYRMLGNNTLIKAHDLEPSLALLYNKIGEKIAVEKLHLKKEKNDFISSFIALLLNQKELTKDMNFDYFKNLTLLKIKSNEENLLEFVVDKFNLSYNFITQNSLLEEKSGWLLWLLVIFSNENYHTKIKGNQEVFKSKLQVIMNKQKYYNSHSILSSIKNLIENL